MKKWSLLLAVLSMGTSPILDEEDSHTLQAKEEVVVQKIDPDEILGEKAVSEIRRSYESGDYDVFLQEIEERYLKADAAGEVELLGAIRPGLSPELRKWEALGQKIQEERQDELLALVESSEERNLFLQKVLSAASDMTQDEKEALYTLSRFQQMAPGTGANQEENLLIAIDLEYEYKALHLGLPNASLIEKRTKQCVLKMDKLKTMESVAAQFQNEELKQIIQTYAKGFDARLAQSWDMADLNGLANGRKKPVNAVEEKVASILLIYQDKLSDLTQQFIEEEKP
ncbi:MAG: hypothetical protein HY324_03255 [Chlamydiia bacterium]|nr:hypothetical protein [Chlamydiia bacterium]